MFPNTTMDLLCSEPSPSSPTEKFFESEKSSNNVNLKGKVDSVHLGWQNSVSPMSDASSGYDSMSNPQSSPNLSSPDAPMPSLTKPTTVTHVRPLVRPEQQVSARPAQVDLNVLEDSRVVKSMIQLESNYIPNQVDNFVYHNSKYDIDEKARTIVTKWMLDVCDEFKCGEAIFPLAINYLDRFILSTPEIRKSQLQLLAVVCLLIASKMRQSDPFDPHDLSYMTANSVSVNQILEWEILVLNRLNWDISSVLATDYLDHIMFRLFKHLSMIEKDQFCSLSNVASSFTANTNVSSSSSSSSSPCSLISSSLSSSSYITRSRCNSFSEKMSTTTTPTRDTSSNTNSKRSLSAPTNNGSSKCNKRVKVEHFHRLSPSSLMLQPIRQQASSLICLAYTALQFVCIPPSHLAAICVGFFVQNISSPSQTQSIRNALASVLEVDPEYIKQKIEFIKEFNSGHSIKSGVSQSSSVSKSSSPVITIRSSSSQSSQLTNEQMGPNTSKQHHEQSRSSYPLGNFSSSSSSPFFSQTEKFNLVHSGGNRPVNSSSSSSSSNSSSHNVTSVSSHFCCSSEAANIQFVHTTFAQVANAKQFLLNTQQHSRHCQHRYHSTVHHVSPAQQAHYIPPSSYNSNSRSSIVSHLHCPRNPVPNCHQPASNNSHFNTKVTLLLPQSNTSLMTFSPDLMITSAYQNDENRENIPVMLSSDHNESNSAMVTGTDSGNNDQSIYSLLFAHEELDDEEDELEELCFD